MTLKEYIATHIDKTTRISDGKEADLIVLPKPFTVPSMQDFFREMYYWDTYFTNKGLILTGNVEQAINNLENFAYLIDTFGYVPNGTRKWLTNRSQPPFFGLAIYDVWKYLTNEQKRNMVTALKKEYAFWETWRTNTDGWVHYGGETSDEEYLWYVDLYNERVGTKIPRTVEHGKDIVAEAESGWDFCPRFPNGCTHYSTVDLNGLLYADEMLLSKIDVENASYWQDKAEARRNVMSAMRDKDGVYFDYDFVQGERSGVYSCAGFFPYFTGVDKDENGFKKLLSELERPYGVAAAQKSQYVFQWAAPNGWAPLFYVCVAAAVRVGDEQSAKRIAEKFVGMLERIFEETGGVYEKYDVETGTLGKGEYGTPEMLGWTAGVYLSLKEYLENGKLL